MEKAVEFILNRLPAVRSKLDEHMLEVINGAAVALVLKVVGAGLTFLFNLVLARTFGAEGAGLYFLALAVTTIATVFGRMGLDNTLLRFTAANAAVDDWAAVKGVYVKGMKLALIASSFSAVAVFFFAPILGDNVFQKPELVIPIRWMSLAVVPMTFVMLHAQALKGLKRIRDSFIVFGVGVPAISLTALLLFGGSYGVNGAIWAYASGAILTALIGVILWHIATPRLQKVTGFFRTSDLLKSSIPLFWIASLNLMINWFATFALGVWGKSGDVGVFGVASRTAMLINIVYMAVNSISAPKFAALYKKNELESLSSTARNATNLMIIISAPMILTFYLFSDLIMSFFGPDFEGFGVVLSILVFGQFINIITGSVGYLLIMSGNEKEISFIVGLVATMSIILNVILIPYAGIVGAAISTTLCLALQNLVYTYYVWSKFRICTIPGVSLFLK